GCWHSLLAAAGTALVMQLDRVSQTFDEPPVVERLAQEVDRSVIERTNPVFVVWVCGNQNHRHLTSPRPQRFLQLKPALSGQFQVSDQACHLCDQSRLEEALCRRESGDGVAQGLDKLAYAVAGQFIIINDRDWRSVGHPWRTSVEPVGMSALCQKRTHVVQQ